MQFEALDRTMRVYETAHDHKVLPGLRIVARLDGRSFTRLVREVRPFEAPFDPRFRDLMVATARHLMDCGFNVIYATTHSDEISLLFHPGTNFNDLPAWQKRGVGLVWEHYDTSGTNPQTGEAMVSSRRRLRVIEELPSREAYGAWVAELLRVQG